MLERVHVENYKCLRDVTVDLGEFTILIGPNDSGKSSFLEVIQSFGKIARQGYAGLFTPERTPGNLVWRKDPHRDIVWEIAGTTDGHRFAYRVTLPVRRQPTQESLEWDGKRLFWTEPAAGGQPHFPPGMLMHVVPTSQGNHVSLAQPEVLYLPEFLRHSGEEVAAISEALASSVEYRFEQEKLASPSVPQAGMVLHSTGANLAAVLDIMQNSADRSKFDALQTALHEAVPSLRGIVLPPTPQVGGAKALEFILSGNGRAFVTIPAAQASTGALLLTAYLTLTYTESADLLLIEEPENGLHPSRLQMVLDILRKVSRGEIGARKRQIVLTTHNPLLLNYARPDEVRVFLRHPEEGTKVIPMTRASDIDRLLKEFALGELWYLLGEEKLFEAQPA